MHLELQADLTKFQVPGEQNQFSLSFPLTKVSLSLNKNLNVYYQRCKRNRRYIPCSLGFIGKIINQQINKQAKKVYIYGVLIICR